MRATFGTLRNAFGIALGIALFGAICASSAKAQCMDMGMVKHGAFMLPQPFLRGHLSSAALRSLAYSTRQDEGKDSGEAKPEPIVGFWKVNFTAEGNIAPPDGTVIDSALAQWHSDGTEIMNSSRPPRSQSFCLGVWEAVGPLKYKLNHFAISWTPDGDSLLGLANIHEEVTLSDDHDSFTGTFTIDQYDTSGNLLAHVTGTLQGKRITPDTPVADVL